MTENPTPEKIVDDLPIIISKQTIDDFLREGNPIDLIGLYAFYYYTAKRQKTNIIKALKVFVLKGAKIGKPRFEKANEILKKMNLIKTIVRHDEKGKITGWYIKVNFIWKQDTIDTLNLVSPNRRKLISGSDPIVLSSHNPVLPQSGLEKTNALNALGAKLLAPAASTPAASARQPSMEAGENFSTKNPPPSSSSLLSPTLSIVLPMEDKQKNTLSTSGYVNSVTSHLQSLTSDITNNLKSTMMAVPTKTMEPKKDNRNPEVQEMLDSLKKKIGFISFADDPDWIRKWGYNLARLKNTIGAEDFWRRVDVLISDPFHRQHLGSPQYLFRQIKGVPTVKIDWSKEWYKVHILLSGAYADMPDTDYEYQLATRWEKYKLFKDQISLGDLQMSLFFNQTYLEQYCYNSSAVREATEKMLVPEELEMSDYDNLIAIRFGEQNVKTPLILRKSKNNFVHNSWAPYLTSEQVKTLIHNTNIQ